jgi:subtilisin family serine protease
VDAVRAAGIEVVAAAQNYGGTCSSVKEPIGIYASAFTVGATKQDDTIASFSSRGPVTADGSGRRKPDISAPGVSVRSAYPVNGWRSMSGTSMATPHVAGLFALVWSAAPGQVGHLAATEASSRHRGSPDDRSKLRRRHAVSVPNNVFGWGRIDARRRPGSTARLADHGDRHRHCPAGGPLILTLALVNLAAGAQHRRGRDRHTAAERDVCRRIGGRIIRQRAVVTWNVQR